MKFLPRQDFFISHTQRNQGAVALAEKLQSSLKEQGKTVWLDVNMRDKSTAAMEEGVRNSRCVIAILTGPVPGEPGTAYMEREFCLKELRWALQFGTPIQPVVSVDDKRQIGDFIQSAPEDLRMIGNIDFIDLNRSHLDYWELGVKLIIQAAGAPGSQKALAHGAQGGSSGAMSVPMKSSSC